VRVAISGSSGLIGAALGRDLERDGHQVRRLVRRAPSGPGEVRWDPAQHSLDPAAVAGLDAVVHLAGVRIGDRRWTERHRRTVLESRVDGTTTISTAAARAEPPPACLISASAVGWYGDTGSREVDETASAGVGFLAEVCARWESATTPARDAGLRVARIRSGLVLSPDGGILGRLGPLFARGLGGRVGSGRQYWPWISLLDEIAAIRFLIDRDIAGPVNLTGPGPVTNAEFARTLGVVLGRPTVLPMPATALRLALGGYADEGVLIGQRAVPRVLTDAGFDFTHRTIEDALRWAIAR
jgi:uncharacterized protein (TIGR01777 family)